MKSIDASQR